MSAPKPIAYPSPGSLPPLEAAAEVLAFRHIQPATNPEIHEIAGRIDQPFYQVHGQAPVPGSEVPVKYTLNVPINLLHDRLHYIVPGFGGFKSSSRLLANAIAADQNSASLRIEPNRHATLRYDLFDPQRLHADTIPAVLDHALNSEQFLDTPGSEKIRTDSFVFDPHSMGGLAVTRFALLHPEDASLINYVEAVGLEPSVGLGFIPRLPGAFRHDILPPIIRGDLREHGSRRNLGRKAMRYYLSNIARTGGEIVSCMTADVTEDLNELRARGVKLGMLYGAEDRLIPAAGAIASSAHRVDLYRVINIGHLGPQTEAQLVASNLADMTRQLIEI